MKAGTRLAAVMAKGAMEVEEGVKSVAESGELFEAITTEMTGVNEQIQKVSVSVQQMSASTEHGRDRFFRRYA